MKDYLHMKNETPKEALISLRDIAFNYPGGPPVLKNLDFDLYTGERVGLLAPNGSGKTTLFHVIMGLLKPTRGRITLFGQPVEKDILSVVMRVRHHDLVHA